MKRVCIAAVIVSLACIAGIAQKKFKPWTEWSLKDATKMINDSPWGQTQIDTNTNEMFFRPTTQTGGGSSADRTAQGATNQAVNLNYRVHFLSARPIRQAIARSILVQQKSPNPQAEAQLKDFADQRSADWIVVAVTYDSTDQRVSGKAFQTFSSANTGILQNETFLETKDGKRSFLKEYRAPGNDGLGAKFVFPRVVDGKPFITAESGWVRFQSSLPQGLKINMRFSIADMTYDGQLEY